MSNLLACPSCQAPVQVAGKYCQECTKCEICHKPLNWKEVEYCERQFAQDENATKPIFEHPSCFKAIEKTALAYADVTIPKALFDKLNACRLLIEPNMDLAKKTNEQDGDIQAQRFIHELAKERSYEEHREYLYMQLSKMESVCATFSLAISKYRRDIEDSLKTKDKKRQAQADNERQAHSDKAPKTHGGTLIASEKKAQGKVNKATALLMALGYSEEEAKAKIAAKPDKATETVN